MDRTREEKITIANEIIRQLGGHKFKVMTGARDIFALDSGVRFKIPGTMTKNHINYIKIWLDPSDTYRMTFAKVGKRGYKEISEHSMVYDDMLQKIFTAETGLDTHL